MEATLREAFEKSAALHQETLEFAAIDKVRSWKEAAPILDNHNTQAEYGDGRAAIPVIPVYAWSATRVYFVHEYDSSFEIFSLPLKPTMEAPDWCGHHECWWDK